MLYLSVSSIKYQGPKNRKSKVSFSWLGHCKMSFYYPSSHEQSREVINLLFVTLLYDLCDGLTILKQFYALKEFKLKFSLGIFKKWPVFVYFCSFLVIISIQIEKSIDGVLGIWTRGRRMEGEDETLELWRPPLWRDFYHWQSKILYIRCYC